MATTTHPPHLLLHNLIVALSYWGTTVRMLLIAFVLLLANVLMAVEGSSNYTLSEYAVQYIYVIGSLFLLDAGYVTVARALPVAAGVFDRVFFLLLMAGLGFVAVLPYFVAVPQGVIGSVKWLFLVSLFVLTLRIVVGFFFGRQAHK